MLLGYLAYLCLVTVIKGNAAHFLWTLHLGVYREIVRHFVSKERLGDVCVFLPYGVHRLQSCSILSKVKLLTCPLLLSVFLF
jgi:hypothetical protein